MIDLHCHVLPGIDDGPDVPEQALALARASAAAGVRTLLATPHVSWHFRNRSEDIAALAAHLRGALAREGVELELLTGAEIASTYLPEIDPEELCGLALGGGEWLLLEPPFAMVAGPLEQTVRELHRRNHRVLIAHPERCPAFHRDPGLLQAMVREGALGSVTAGSLVGRFGETNRRFALWLVREGLAHNVASDAHDISKRAPGMSAELRRAGLEWLSDWLTQQVPEAILAGGPVPPRPHTPSPPSRRWRSRR